MNVVQLAPHLSLVEASEFHELELKPGLRRLLEGETAGYFQRHCTESQFGPAISRLDLMGAMGCTLLGLFGLVAICLPSLIGKGWDPVVAAAIGLQTCASIVMSIRHWWALNRQRYYARRLFVVLHEDARWPLLERLAAEVRYWNAHSLPLAREHENVSRYGRFSDRAEADRKLMPYRRYARELTLCLNGLAASFQNQAVCWSDADPFQIDKLRLEQGGDDRLPDDFLRLERLYYQLPVFD